MQLTFCSKMLLLLSLPVFYIQVKKIWNAKEYGWSFPKSTNANILSHIQRLMECALSFPSAFFMVNFFFQITGNYVPGHQPGAYIPCGTPQHDIAPTQVESCPVWRRKDACFILPVWGHFLYWEGRLRWSCFLLKRSLLTNFTNTGTSCGYHVDFGDMACVLWGVCFFFQVCYL